MKFKILFKNGRPAGVDKIKATVKEFNARFGYQTTVREIIRRSEKDFDRETFFMNSAQLMTNFKMTRSGPFKGVTYKNGNFSDPNGVLETCWKEIGKDLVSLRASISLRWQNRTRILADVDDAILDETTTELWKIFKKLLPTCMSTYSWGVVSASKIVFSAVPEISLPIDNFQWKALFKTVDYKDILTLMTAEIKAWETAVGRHLDVCDPQKPTTLPAIYNVMAMKARI